MNEFILKIFCDDEKGLIYKISDLIFYFNLNIIKNNEFVSDGKFFFRAILEGSFDEAKFLDTLRQKLAKNSNIELHKRAKKKIAILATKETHCLGDILIKHYSKELLADIELVISNHSDLQNLVELFGIKFHTVSHKDISKEEHEARILELLSKYKLDYIVLAKYMRILSPEFVEKYENKIINIHHSFLPAFIGANPYKQAFERGVKIIGATAHFVNDMLDNGPIITQGVININHDYSWQDMKRAGQSVEKDVLLKALELAFEDRIFIHKNKTVIF